MAIDIKEITKKQMYIDYIKEQEIRSVYKDKVSALVAPIFFIVISAFCWMNFNLTLFLKIISVSSIALSIGFWINVYRSGAKIFISMVLIMLAFSESIFASVYCLSKIIFGNTGKVIFCLFFILVFILFCIYYVIKNIKELNDFSIIEPRNRYNYDISIVITISSMLYATNHFIFSSGNQSSIFIIYLLLIILGIYSNKEVTRIVVKNSFKYYLIKKYNLEDELDL